MQSRLASAGLLGRHERPVKVTRSATTAGSLRNASFYLEH